MITQIKKKITQIKITKVIIYLLVINAFLLSSLPVLAVEWDEEPRLKTPTINPYSYFPMETRRPPTRVDRMKRPLPAVAPQSPAIVTDKYGNKSLYQDGRLRSKLDRDGTVTYYAQNQARFQKDQDRLIRLFEYNGPERITKNEFSNILSYERYGLGGKLLYGYDSRHNLTHRYEYDGREYWQINELTKTWKKYELDKPIDERRGGKSGALVAYWRQEGDSFWRIEKTADANGNSIDGNRTRYDRFGIEHYETFANDGVRIARYVWQGHRLKYEIDQTNHYKKYNRYGVYEEGFLSEAGIEYREWLHTWEGTKHIKAMHRVLNLNPYVVVYDQVRYFDLNENIERITQIISQEDVNRDKAKRDNDPHKIGLKDEDVGKEFVLEDYIYFHEIKDLTQQQIKELLRTTDERAGHIWELIDEMKRNGKADAGLALVAGYDFNYRYNPSQPKAMHLANIQLYDRNNLFTAQVLGTDPTAPPHYYSLDYYGRTLMEQAQSALERGDTNTVLDATRRFIERYRERALTQQRSLREIPQGNDILRYTILNMVGLAYSLQGDAYVRQSKTEEAKIAYREVINNLSYSQRYDSQTQTWKSLKLECQQKLNQIP